MVNRFVWPLTHIHTPRTFFPHSVSLSSRLEHLYLYLTAHRQLFGHHLLLPSCHRNLGLHMLSIDTLHSPAQLHCVGLEVIES